MDDDILYLTPNERAAYAERLKRAVEVGKPEVEGRLRRLGAMGEELDEDEYDDALDDQAGVEGTIDYLPGFLDRARSITAEQARADQYVRLGSQVVVRAEDGAETTYKIAGPFDIDWSKGRLVTHRSPIACALFGKRPGDIVTVRGPGTPFTLEILRMDQSSIV